jgi:hypothetical protein
MKTTTVVYEIGAGICVKCFGKVAKRNGKVRFHEGVYEIGTGKVVMRTGICGINICKVGFPTVKGVIR